ncbi:MAG: cadherin-like domain-containing protein, partial [Bacteroidota bacterium]
QVFQPLTPLAAFNGVATGSGIAPWTLAVLDNVQGNGGELISWSMEACTEREDPPLLIRNETLWLEAGNTKPISDLNLRAQDPSTAPADMVFTLVTLPDSGVLELSGIPLAVGETFTQENINNGDLTYTATTADPSSPAADQFDFTVTSATGGWVGVPTFIIDVRPVSNDKLLKGGWSIYPNPATDMLTLTRDQVPAGDVTIRLVDIQGRIILQKKMDYARQTEQLNVSEIAEGVYGVQVSDENGVFVHKVLIKR